MRLPTQRKEYMPKTTPIDRTCVLQAALVGFEMQRGRIDAAVREIQTELAQGGTLHKDTRRSTATATDSAEPKATGKKRFSRAARKRMALAQKKRWQLLKAKNAEAAKPRRKTAAAKRRKASVAASRKQQPVQVKAPKTVARKVVMKAAPKPKAKASAPKPKASKPATPPSQTLVEVPAPQVQPVAEAQPATA